MSYSVSPDGPQPARMITYHPARPLLCATALLTPLALSSSWAALVNQIEPGFWPGSMLDSASRLYRCIGPLLCRNSPTRYGDGNDAPGRCLHWWPMRLFESMPALSRQSCRRRRSGLPHSDQAQNNLSNHCHLRGGFECANDGIFGVIELCHKGNLRGSVPI